LETLDVTTSTLGAGAGVNVKLTWDGSLGPDIPSIAGGTYQPLYDIQYWHATNNAWRELQDGREGSGSMDFTARCAGDYQFRIRVRAEQPEGSNGSWPNQRYSSEWSEPRRVSVPGDATGIVAPLPEGAERIYMPAVSALGGC
jgi:hypothetical protein